MPFTVSRDQSNFDFAIQVVLRRRGCALIRYAHRRRHEQSALILQIQNLYSLE